MCGTTRRIVTLVGTWSVAGWMPRRAFQLSEPLILLLGRHRHAPQDPHVAAAVRTEMRRRLAALLLLDGVLGPPPLRVDDHQEIVAVKRVQTRRAALVQLDAVLEEQVDAAARPPR